MYCILWTMEMLTLISSLLWHCVTDTGLRMDTVLNVFGAHQTNCNSHNPSKMQPLFTVILLSQLPNQSALWSMRHHSESAGVFFRSQRTTDLIFLQLINAARLHVPSLSELHKYRNKWWLLSYLLLPTERAVSLEKLAQPFGHEC